MRLPRTTHGVLIPFDIIGMNGIVGIVMPFVRFELEPDIHRRFKVWAMESGYTMQGAFDEWVESKVGLVKTPVSPVSVARKVAVEESRKASDMGLKEGYGWCMGCKVEQVKLPGVLCKECAK